jgi:hypothetical protein
MKYYFVLLLFSISFIRSNAQESTHVKNKGYEGYIFSEKHFIFMSIENQKKRYTPTINDIKEAEVILKDSIDAEMEKYCPYPCKPNGEARITKTSLKKYKRQYVGFLTNDGDTIVYINLLYNDDIPKDRLSSDIVWVLDGGSHYWQIYVNITKRRLFGMSINGIA